MTTTEDELFGADHLADALERVTNGTCTRLIRARWRARGLLITPTGRIPDAEGRPVTYSRLALIEARLVYEAGVRNIDQTLVSLALRDRVERLGGLVQVAETGAAYGYYVDDGGLDMPLLAAAWRSGQLQEFELRPEGGSDAYWLVPFEQTRGRQVTEARCYSCPGEALGRAMADILRDRPAALLASFNVSAAVRAVEAALKGA